MTMTLHCVGRDEADLAVILDRAAAGEQTVITDEHGLIVAAVLPLRYLYPEPEVPADVEPPASGHTLTPGEEQPEGDSRR
jgi:antitoxin (DNA-binding transcriptional repressor) of toxin-antitoxin stability system